ncbi:MAG: ABC transporter permease [Ilumatobacteraceae bacterium]|nr:ABC transporter permease [Ilumatobacteraceae bacterium]
MLRLTLSNLWSRKRRLTGAAVAIVIGVAFLFATLTVSDTLRAGFDDVFTAGTAGTDVVVRSATEIGSESAVQRGLVPESVADRLLAIDGVEQVVSAYEGTGQIVGRDGQRVGGDGPPANATGWIDDAELTAWRIAEGRAPASAGEVVIDRASARTGGLAVGDRTTVMVPGPEPVTVVGIATFDGADSQGPATFVMFDPETAQRLLVGDDDRASSLLIAAGEGVSPDALAARIAGELPADLEALTGAELAADQLADVEGDFLGFVRFFLTAFAGVALVVAAFGISTTLTIVAAQRTRESALLRALGGTRRQVLVASLVESALLGAVASAAGLGVGWVLGVGLRALLAGFGIDLPGSGLVVDTASVVTAIAAGTLVTIVAGLAPAVRASRVEPLAALRDVAIDRSGRSVPRAVAGAILAVAGGALVVAAASAAMVGLGVLALLGGIVLAGPVLVGPIVGVLGAPVRRLRGEPGRLAVANATRNPARTASTATGLLVGTAVVALFTSLGASVTASIDESVSESFGGDLVVSGESFSGAALDPELAPSLAAVDGVEHVSAISVVPALVGGSDVGPLAVDPAEFEPLLDVGVVEGDLASMGVGELAVSTGLAAERGWTLGRTVPVAFANGDVVPATVAAVYDVTGVMGDVIMHRDDWTPRARGAGDVVVMIGLADGADRAATTAEVADLAESFGAPAPQTREQYVDDVAAQVDQLLGLVYGLLALAVLIALIGIGNALSLAVHERTREVGMLRAVGLTRRQLRTTVRWEAVLTAVAGAAGGIAVGVLAGWGLLRAVGASEGLGVFVVPITPLAVVLVVAGLAGTIAAARPARRAARLDVVSALGVE